ncbi:hypothetical protein [Mucilaginibacter pankratovii]|nr:hypothetical protein [Mucilaginibacter pankratovii]
MIRSRTKKVLLVAPKAFPDALIAGYNTVRQVSVQTAIFPSIHEVKPDVILFDYEYMGPELEKVLRRLQSNSFYRNIKICCYKNKEHTRIDGLLKVLGVNHFFYQEDVEKVSKSKAALNAVNSVLDATIVNWVAGVA